MTSLVGAAPPRPPPRPGVPPAPHRVSPGRVGCLPACRHRPRHPPRPLPHLLWRQGPCAGRPPEVGDSSTPTPPPSGAGEEGAARPPSTPALPPRRGSPPSADELQDFLARVFRGGSGATPGGPFPPPPPAATPGGAAAAAPGAPPRADSAVPKGEAKHKRRKKTRRPLQR